MADLTYIRILTGFVYLAVILDAWSRRVVGWALGRRVDADLALAALEGAIAGREPPPGCVHHSDRGSQGGLKRSSQHRSAPTVALVKGLGWRSPAERLARPAVECRRHGRKVAGTVRAQVGALREVLPQQPVGVLVRAALPRAMRVAEVDLHAGVDPQLRMLAISAP